MIAELQERCSRLAGEAFRRDGELRAMIWLLEDADGALSEFSMPCSAPADVDDATALVALCAEMREDFARDRITAFAVAYTGRVRLVPPGSAVLAHPPPSTYRKMVVVEAHDGVSSRIGVRDIVANPRPHLGPLLKNERATGRFGGLLAARAERDIRRRGGQPGVWPH